MENEEKICQSCCLPLNEKTCGTEANEDKSKDYCCDCYKSGVFTNPDATMETILDISAKVWADKDPSITPEEAKVRLREKMPTLKRWKE